ncbi:unnamed protein product [Gongylonema pulchrum]|uniref:Uncharacterized protein n=1 Tax=Gongylonema pulchrum TaxID=637853 RepID=A0A183DZ48_9BILA|nr:unnamed protein product [Gongylonema pulchrum]
MASRKLTDHLPSEEDSKQASSGARKLVASFEEAKNFDWNEIIETNGRNLQFTPHLYEELEDDFEHWSLPAENPQQAPLPMNLGQMTLSEEEHTPGHDGTAPEALPGENQGHTPPNTDSFVNWRLRQLEQQRRNSEPLRPAPVARQVRPPERRSAPPLPPLPPPPGRVRDPLVDVVRLRRKMQLIMMGKASEDVRREAIEILDSLQKASFFCYLLNFFSLFFL